MKKQIDKKNILKIFLVTAILLTSSIIAVTYAKETKDTSNKEPVLETIHFVQNFSKPVVEKNNGFVEVKLEEANSYMPSFGMPKLPYFVKIFKLPWGSEIENIEYNVSKAGRINISSKVKPVPTIEKNKISNTQIRQETSEIYEDDNRYPSEWLSYHKGAGLNEKNEHVLHLPIQVYPVVYLPNESSLEYISKINVSITYNIKQLSTFSESDNLDLVIITVDKYKNNLERLKKHKTNNGLKTEIFTTEEIYNQYPGVDKPEQIKFFVKNVVEQGANYILLVGDIDKIPIRATDAYPWEGFGNNILSDLYYADIYDENFTFCSWDDNQNQVYGEINYSMNRFPPDMGNIDKIDLYADVHIGRLPCRMKNEVDLLVEKILNYENKTYGTSWFKKMIVAGGDTFPPSKNYPLFTYEGEITNKKVVEQMPEDFKIIKLQSSRHTLNWLTFNLAFSFGAGFLSYSGHGFEHGWGTYRPNAIFNKRLISYFTPFLQFLRNYEKQPIVFYDACLTAKLDFNMSSLENYYPNLVKIWQILTGTEYNPKNYYPCFAWSTVNQKHGGAIAAIGATRPAYTLVDDNGVYAGAGFLNTHFFKAYKEGINLGNMLTKSKNDYLNYLQKDFFTIEEFMLIGDPSLKVGGYPS